MSYRGHRPDKFDRRDGLTNSYSATGSHSNGVLSLVLLVDGIADTALREGRVAQEERDRARRSEEAIRRNELLTRFGVVVLVIVIAGVAYTIYSYWDGITDAILSGLKWLWENIILPVIGLAMLVLFLVGGCMAALDSI